MKESKVTFFSFRTGSSDAAAAKGFFRYKVRADLGVKAALTRGEGKGDSGDEGK